MTSTVDYIVEPLSLDKHKMRGDSVDSDDLRNAFAMAMSQMYRDEVPLYGDLMRIVLNSNQMIHQEGTQHDSLERLTVERHGAIRLGKPEELRMVSRIFSVLGMYPVGYYDLSVADLPMHATCFRPIDQPSLQRNPFRVFTTLLRPDLLRSDAARDLALKLLSQRQLFSSELMRILDGVEQNGRLSPEEAIVFIREALKTFSWAPLAATSFLALEEPIQFLGDDHQGVLVGSHRARFGEIEERGAAVTPAGRKLYDELLIETMEATRELGSEDAELIRRKIFEKYPDTWSELRGKGLIYSQYRCGKKTTEVPDIDAIKIAATTNRKAIEHLIEIGALEATFITYEDFLPFSAAGIFQSNLDQKSNSNVVRTGPDQDTMENALGGPIIDPDSLYEAAQRNSLVSSLSELRIKATGSK
ncbi:hypothetical protein NPX13_g8049 [Xylaria arbuscula]|uniref:2-oxoadipate dioxygenase/decarboxylase n=1 Tax=Xylaria arbuscula TaxID=114810 RepID=A0A9W8N9C3_9PEZI|nr:hypothetical protein NPX13_g8049 [Xylaria arbuscula]